MTIRPSIALLLSAALVLGGCEKDDPPSQWEILRGTASLEVSAAVTPGTPPSQIAIYTRTGSLTIGEDSSTSGWIRLTAGPDSVHLDGMVTNDGGDLIVTFESLVPGEYTVITRDDYPDTYALLSTAVLTSDITGDAVPEQHRLYWQFSR